MKKITGLVLLAASIVASVYLISFGGNPIRYSQCIVSQEGFLDIIAVRTEVQDMATGLIFDEERLFLDAADKTFYYSLIEGSSSAYDPKITIHSKNKSAKVAFLADRITDDLIRNARSIPLLIYTPSEYCIYDLKCTTLPLMNIDCPEEPTDKEIDIPMSLTLFDNRAGSALRLTSSDGQIRVRGASTLAYPKKGYRLSLTQGSVGGHERSNDVSLLGMRQDDDWLLYAAYNDQEKIRNVFSSNLWKYTCAEDNAYGIDAGMEYQYLELFINDTYWGLYALGYPVDSKQLELDTASGKDALYKYYGYVNEHALTYTEDGTIDGIGSKGTAEGQQDITLFQRYFDDLAQNHDDITKLRAGIDIDNAIDIYLFINLIQGFDNVNALAEIKNMYLAVMPDEKGLTALYVPWDLDMTWGNSWIFDLAINHTLTYEIPADENYIMENGHLEQLLIDRDPDIWDTIFKKYWGLRSGGWSEKTIDALLDIYEEDIYGSGAYLRDMARWPDGTYADPSDGLGTFRTFVKERLSETDMYYRKLAQLRDESIFIQRSARYKDFLEHTFVIEINGKDVLKDPDYIDLLEYIGVDTALITEDVRFVIAEPSKKTCSYHTLSDLYPKSPDIPAVTFRVIIGDGRYRMYLDGEPLCVIPPPFPAPEIQMVMVKEGISEVFDLKKGFGTHSAPIDSLERLELYMADMSMSTTGYAAIFEINDPALWNDPRYMAFFEDLGVPEGSIRNNTDLIIWSPKDAVYTLEDFHVSGSRNMTPMGELSLFTDEQGLYALYLDGNECFISSKAQNADIAIRILLIDPGSQEIVEMLAYTEDDLVQIHF